MAMYTTLAFHDENDKKEARIFALDTIRETKVETFQDGRSSKRTFFLCSLILIATAGLLVAWIFVARPKIYPKLHVLTKRSFEEEYLHDNVANERYQEISSNEPYLRRRRSVTSQHRKNFEVTLLTKEKDYPINEYRLPTNLVPERYYINLDIDIDSDNFTGNVKIAFKCIGNTDKIIFHGRRITLTNANVTSDHKKVNIISVSYIKTFEMFILELEGDLMSGDDYEVNLDYVVGYGESLAGLYKSSYKHKEKKRFLVSTHFEPTDARSAFPCFDEPAFKATFYINITHSKEYTALSNMPVKKTTNHGKDIVTDQFEPTVKMSTYLVAFSVNDFKFKEKTTTSGIKVRCYAPENDYNRIDYAVEAGATIISFYEDLFKIKYPLPKLDLLAVPDFMAGAMEDWGLVSFRSAYLIFDEKIMTVEYLRQITLVIAHELAHQWFGNLVTMKWWNDLWLNEGFANFIEMLGTNQVNPQFNALDIQVVTGWQAAIGLDSLNNSHPVSQDVMKPNEIDELFDAISYNKGAALLRMLHGFLGQDFIDGVRMYLTTNKFSNAETDDLWKHLSQASSEKLEIKKIMDTWARQTCFPVLTISRNSSNDSKFTVRQESLLEAKLRLIHNDSQPISINKSLWQVPFTYISEESLKPTTVWLSTEETKINLETSIPWLKANVQSKGFYVVNYDNQTWYGLRLQLIDNYQVFSPVDRANIIHDVFKLACERMLDPITALEVTKYISKEHDYIPWAMMRSKSECLFPFLSSKATKEKLKRYIWKLQSHLVDLTMLNYSNATAKRNLSIFERLQLMETFSYALKHHQKNEFRKRVSEIFDDMVRQKNLPGLTVEVRALALMYGHNTSLETHWNYLWQVYVNSEVDTDRKLMMKAFAQVKDKDKVKQLLEKSLDSNTMRVQDTIPLLANVVKFGSRKTVWDFVIKNYEKFRSRYGGGYQLGQLLNEVASGFTTKSELNEVKKFLDAHPVGSKGSRTEKQILEKIENNIRRHAKDDKNKEVEDKIKKWLNQEER